MTCERCAAIVNRVIFHRSQLWCAVCVESERSVESATAVFRDGIPGGITLENYGPHPITFYSHAERRAYMKAKGLQEKEKFCPMPGTDKDPQGIPNPKGYMDPVTLANAAELIRRNGTSTKEWNGIESGVLRNMTRERVSNRRRVRDAVISR